MDGNGRWAKARGLTREEGHTQGAKAFRRIVEYCGDVGINVVTVYAFSTENWKRPLGEVTQIMKLLSEYIDLAKEEYERRKLTVRFIGRRDRIPRELLSKMEALEKMSAGNSRTLNIALDYGAQAEIVDAVNSLISSGKKKISENDLEGALWTSPCPPPDLIVRTAGEKRLSNFLLWQAAYAELYFTDVLWPDMTERDVDAALEEFERRTRRFGAVV